MYIHRQSYPHIIYRNIPYAFKQILQELEVTVNVAPKFRSPAGCFWGEGRSIDGQKEGDDGEALAGFESEV